VSGLPLFFVSDYLIHLAGDVIILTMNTGLSSSYLGTTRVFSQACNVPWGCACF